MTDASMQMLGSIRPTKILDKTTGVSPIITKEDVVDTVPAAIKSPESFDLMNYFDITSLKGIDAKSLRNLAEVNSFLMDNDLQKNAKDIIQSIEQRFSTNQSISSRIDNIYDYVNTLKNNGYKKSDELLILGDDSILKAFEDRAHESGDWTPFLRVFETVNKLKKEVRK